MPTKFSVTSFLMVREAETIVRLTHPNLIQFFDFGELPNGTLALVMEMMAEHGADARSAVLYTKPRTIIQPDYSWRQTDLWITFPWSAAPPVEIAPSSAEGAQPPRIPASPVFPDDAGRL